MVTTTTAAAAEAEDRESLGTKFDRTLLRLYPSSALPNPTTKMVTTTTEAEARESLGTKLDRLKEHAKDMASRHPVAGAAAVLAVSAVGAYFLWPVAAPAVAMMKAPGAGGVLVSRAAFLANKKLYFKLLHTAGAAAAVAALA
ncbi:uncharacterized protein [Miscanthus floridulus]|uniref:uncharacterized protein n=1 Tax=Miscanthus floridulus TaxID=154761 RepID=UPI00345AA3FA